MPEFDDGYGSYYAERLWQRLPAVYRALDSELPGVSGPLHELIARLGAQIAAVRRSIDRLWANQSIETCDDWVIPYLGDLLATELVNDDPRGQRLEVAKTIHYRRRKGTLAGLEEIARDVTGWQAHVVEGFRRLGRTRHSLDPPVGPEPVRAAFAKLRPGAATEGHRDPHELTQHEGLAGILTGTPAGGFADLRSVHGAQLADSPFDEYFHTADVRTGRGSVGWFGIPKLLVFLWRLRSFSVAGGTPVAVAGSSTRFVFDPTGRHVPLFLPPLGPEPDDWVDAWTAAREWQVPGPLSDTLADALADPGTAPPRHAPYPGGAGLPLFSAVTSGSPPEQQPITVTPETGEFTLAADASGPFTVSYQYGFPATVGAGPYDRSLETGAPPTSGAERRVAGGSGLDAALAASAGAGTVTVADSLTYAAVSDVALTAPGAQLLVRAAESTRPVIRLPAPAQATSAAAEWVFTGGGPDSELTLDGLLISGGDLVLRGGFATVRITACTADPGTLDAAGEAFAGSVDGRPLAPTRIWIEADPGAAAGTPATIGTLSIDHCVLGPVRTRNGGAVEQLAISDSIVQDAAPSTSGPLTSADVRDQELLMRVLSSGEPTAVAVRAGFEDASQTAALKALRDYGGGPVSTDALAAVLGGLNATIAGADLRERTPFAALPVAPPARHAPPLDRFAANRALLEAAFPVALSSAALAIADGTLALTRVTVLGRTFAHRLRASDTILAGHAVVDNLQDGCVRFSAHADGSVLPSRYESISLVPGAALFTSTEFGRPGYGQLLATADLARAVRPPALAGAAITTGAENGSEMGAFSGQLGPLKEQRLLTKFAEYMPLGLTPVVVHVT